MKCNNCYQEIDVSSDTSGGGKDTICQQCKKYICRYCIVECILCNTSCCNKCILCCDYCGELCCITCLDDREMCTECNLFYPYG